ncbi:hypothetical protein C8F04DRAFT_1252742 [Mycena alexandri]|uniref:C2H2-type domain-containing protein n=1 Tax=Mycena alexandri TaxID=1745969 RepID=A0AAD6X7F2_9AGAR|nr:hypothetical protein C8F04DRAFT_1252742 [Mycena alexandri]
MLIECTECQLPYYTYEDLDEHYEVTHPKLHRLQNRLDVRIAKRILNRHQKTFRCPCCYMPFPHPELRDSHVELAECDPEDDSDCEREPGLYGTLRRSRVDSIVNKVAKLTTRARGRRGSTSSTCTSSSTSSSRRSSLSS